MLRRDVAFSRRSVLTEQDVQTLWELQAFRSRVFLTEEGVRAEVFFPGFRARIAGPDFRAAVIRMGGAVRVGGVEVHLTPSG